MFVILASNSDSKVQVFGTPDGKPFKTEAAANRAAKRLDRFHPGIDFLVLPISSPVSQREQDALDRYLAGEPPETA